MAQYALPTSDNVVSNWAEGAGDANGNAYEELDEGFGSGRGSGSGPDDATTYWVTTDEGINTLSMNLGAVTDPTVHTGHVWRTRNRKSSSGGRQLDLITNFHEGGPPIASQTVTNIDAVWTSRGRAITEVEAANITDYTALGVVSSIQETGGGTPRVGWESAQEFECPDAPTGGQPTQHRTQGVPTGSGSRDRPGKWN